MKTPTFRTAVCLSLLLSSPLIAHAQAPKKPTAPGPDATVVAAQTNLQRVQTGSRAGVNTSADVSEATESLALAQIRAALVQKATESIPPELAVLQDQRRERLRLVMTDR